MGKDADQYSSEEAAHRRDEVIRRMANTPPQPKVTPSRRQGRKKKIVADRAARNSRADRER